MKGRTDAVPKSPDHRSVPLQREVYFPTYIYYRDLPDTEAHALNAGLAHHVRAWRDEDPDGIVRSNVREAGVWHSRLDMAARFEYQSLVEWILLSAGEVFEDLGYNSNWEPAISNMWAVVSPRCGFNRSHMHPGSLWSGVYYVQSPEDAGRIVFSDPRAQVRMMPYDYERPGHERPESWDQVYFDPIEGRMLLFPAWLVHEVEPNMSSIEGHSGDRISVSFNIGQRRSMPN